MPPPRPLDLLPRLDQTTATRLDEAAHRALRGRKAGIAPFRRGVEQHGERGVALSRLLPDAEVVLGLFDGGGGGVDLPLDVGGAGDCAEGEGFAEFVGGPGELACVVSIAGPRDKVNSRERGRRERGKMYRGCRGVRTVAIRWLCRGPCRLWV